jgi:hypothetical protein
MSVEKRDHFILEKRDVARSRSGKAVRVTSPDKVLPIHDEKELKLQLEHYSRGILKFICPNSTFARLFYVEKTRPALRFYCAKFGVAVPEWLKNEDYFLSLTEREKLDLFGTTELRPREFTKIKTFGPGEVVSK